uniref:amino acid adenylation domain-containing protein n=1 Tax=Maribacter sp. 2-571 TaxID=3417569 RepID=UPI003D34E88B
RELLQQVKGTTLGAYDHQSAPFEKVVDRVVTSRDMSMPPLFQVMFILQNTPDEDTEANGSVTDTPFEALPYENEHTNAKFDLTMGVNENESGISLGIEYCTALFEETTVRRMLVHYEQLLRSIVADPASRITDLSMLTAPEEKQLLEVFNTTEIAYPDDKTMVDLFEIQARRTPNAIALICGDTELTYHELDQKSNRLARYLRTKCAVKEGMIVGICMNRSEWAIISILAVLKTGSAYVPIDATYPLERIEYMITDSSIGLLLTESTNIDNVPVLKQLTVLQLDMKWDVVLLESSRKLGKNSTPYSGAYVIYTSGSTGNPKGVMVSHGGNVNMSLDQVRTFGITGSDRVLQFASLSFDASVYEIFMAFYSGASLVIAGKDVIGDREGFVSYLRDKSVSMVTLPPSYLRVLPLDELRFLRVIVTAGESPDIEKAVYCSGFSDYYNAYGPTECSVCVSVYKVGASDIGRQHIPIGSAISNTKLYVLDGSQGLVPVGVLGELCVSGAGLAQGYINRSELTSEKFISNPFDASGGGSLYRTGDLVRWLSDGTIEYVGRIDDQVKVRGYRIELGEVESALSGISAVSGCSVQVHPDGQGNNQLVGYVVGHGGSVPDKDDIQRALSEKLPGYMVPQLWVSLDALPLTVNGKVDRKALPIPGLSERSTVEYVAPRNDVEQQLSEIWKELLGVERVGALDNFFELGGNSILAISLVAKINKAFSSTLGIVELFKYPTVEKLEARLQSGADQSNNILVTFNDDGNQRPMFCTPAIGGSVMGYYDLVEALDDSQPFYAFQCPGLDGKTPLSDSIEDMASTFIDEMQKIDPIGPYTIGAYSFGAITAYEMVLQLVQKGYEVSKLIIFDAPPLEKQKIIKEFDLKKEITEIVKIINEDFDLEIVIPDSVFENKTKEEQLEMIYSLIQDSGIDATIEQIKGHIAVYINNRKISNEYNPVLKEKFNTEVTLFVAPESLSNELTNPQEILENPDHFKKKPDYGWSEHTNDQVAFFVIEGSDHQNIIDPPFVEEVAFHLNNSLSVEIKKEDTALMTRDYVDSDK